MKSNPELYTGSKLKKIAFAKRTKQPSVELTIQEFMKAIPVAYIRENGCLPTIRLKQEGNLKIDTRGQMEGSGFSIAAYYENGNGMKVPVEETYGTSFIQALIKLNGPMPYPPTATEYDPDNKHYPYTEDIFKNVSTYLAGDKDRRIVISPDPAKINGKPNMVVSFATAENPYLSGTYDSNSFHVVCLGVTNVLEALRITEEILPQVELFRAENPDIFMTDAKPFGYPIQNIGQFLNQKETLEPLPLYTEDDSYMPEEYDVQGEGLNNPTGLGPLNTDLSEYTSYETVSYVPIKTPEEAKLAETELVESGFSLASIKIGSTISQDDNNGQAQ